jgi:hypothetical protein
VERRISQVRSGRVGVFTEPASTAIPVRRQAV